MQGIAQPPLKQITKQQQGANQRIDEGLTCHCSGVNSQIICIIVFDIDKTGAETSEGWKDLHDGIDDPNRAEPGDVLF